MTISRSEEGQDLDLTTFEKKFKRRLVRHCEFEPGVTLYAVYADKALTGFLCYAHEARFGKFEATPCVLLPLEAWVKMRNLAEATVTASLVLVRGTESLKVAHWGPVSGLKYAVRDDEEHNHPFLYITAGDFKDV